MAVHCLANANFNRANCVVSTEEGKRGTEREKHVAAQRENVCVVTALQLPGKIGENRICQHCDSRSDGLVRITRDRNEARDNNDPD